MLPIVFGGMLLAGIWLAAWTNIPGRWTHLDSPWYGFPAFATVVAIWLLLSFFVATVSDDAVNHDGEEPEDNQ